VVRLASAIQRMIDECLVMRLNCANILKMPGLAWFGPHPLGEGLRRRFRTSAKL
jgi:hypothetical protein